MLSGIRIGEPSSYCGQLRPILSNSRIFGSDLVSLGMDKLIEEMFISEIEGTGAVRNTLKKYLDGNK